MKVNVDTALKNLDGTLIKSREPKMEDGEQVVDADNNPVFEMKDMLLKDVIVNAMCSTTKKDEGMTGKEKFVNYSISQTVYKGGEVELTAEEIAKIKERVGMVYSPIIVGNVFNLLEQKEK